MNLLLVTFSLRDPNRDYSQFFVALRGNAIQWWHFIEQTCVVTTYLDINQLTNALSPYILTSDSLLVVKLEPHGFQGWLPKEAWDWFAKVSERISGNQFPGLVP